MAVSVAFVPLFVIAIGALGYPYFRRVCGFDKPTAYFCAMPGGLQDMLVFGIEAGGNARALSLVHATRVLAIVSILPAILSFGWGLSFDARPARRCWRCRRSELGLMLVCAVVGWKGGERIGLFGAAILGPMALTAAASLAGLIHFRPPAEAILAAQFFIGLGVGVKYVGVTPDEVRRIVAAALGYCVILAVLSVAFAEAVHFVAGRAAGRGAARLRAGRPGRDGGAGLRLRRRPRLRRHPSPRAAAGGHPRGAAGGAAVPVARALADLELHRRHDVARGAGRRRRHRRGAADHREHLGVEVGMAGGPRELRREDVAARVDGEAHLRRRPRRGGPGRRPGSACGARDAP